MKKIIVVFGATGNLGIRIVKSLIDNDAEVKCVVRATSESLKIEQLQKLGAAVYKVNQFNVNEISGICNGASCVVSALSGLRDVIVDTQKIVLDATIKAKVPRFIPSDYSLDFTKFLHGENRNLDLRREFHAYMDKTSISATSIFNGAFTELLTNEMQMILFKQKIILYWGSANYKWGFTTMDNTAEFTAKVALQSSTPRYLRVAGDLISPQEVHGTVSRIMGQKFRLFSPGGKQILGAIIKITRKLSPAEKELYPAWQGMQYMHNMIDERSKIDTLDNDRYPEMKWTTVNDILSRHKLERGF